MNHPFSFPLVAVAAIATLWLAFLWLWPRCAHSPRPGVVPKLIAGVATVLLLFVPVGGSPLWSRVFSFYPTPSLPMLGVISAALWLRLFNLPVFSRGDWSAIWLFGAIGGSALYLHPMIFGGVDLYYWGWDRAVAAGTVSGLAIGLLARGNRLGVLLFAALLGYALNALESQNCWDYVMDPFFWIVSAGVLIVRVGTVVFRTRGSAGRNIEPAAQP